MTDRLKGVVVTFEQDIRDDDAESTLEAIRHIRGVLSVKPLVSGPEQGMAEDRVRHEIYGKLLDVIYPDRRK